MIEIKDLSYKIEGKEILNHINLTFDKCQTYAIIGPNGAGKSTLLKHVMRILPVAAKCIYMDNKDITTFSVKDYAKKCSFVFQENNRDFELTVEEMITMGRYPYVDFLGHITAADHKIVQEIMKDLDLLPLAKQSVCTLSGGEAQKVFIARALAQQAQVMLLDEPTSMLDIHNSIEILNQLKRIQDKYDLTLIMVMHDLNLAFQYADFVVLLKNGNIVLNSHAKTVITSAELKHVYQNKIHIINDGEKTYIVPKAD